MHSSGGNQDVRRWSMRTYRGDSMSDQERLIQFLQSLEFKRVEGPIHLVINKLRNREYAVSNNTVYLGSEKSYSSFYSWFEFDNDGKYTSNGAAE